MKEYKGEHIESCAVQHKTPCPANQSLHGEKPDEHWWSGWPGAYCLKCGAEDLDELCIGNSCECPCHDEFWNEYYETQRMKKRKK